MAKKRQLRIRVEGQRRQQVDTRRLARAIVRLAVEMDTEQAQALADELEAQEAERATTIRRTRAAQRSETDASPTKGAA